MAGRYDITIEQGSTFTLNLTMEQDDGSGNIIPVDLTGASVRSKIKKGYKSSDVLLDLGGGGYISIDDEPNGKIVVSIPASVTETFDFHVGAVYDIEIEYQGGTVERILKGRVDLSEEVTT